MHPSAYTVQHRTPLGVIVIMTLYGATPPSLDMIVEAILRNAYKRHLSPRTYPKTLYVAIHAAALACGAVAFPTGFDAAVRQVQSRLDGHIGSYRGARLHVLHSALDDIRNGIRWH